MPPQSIFHVPSGGGSDSCSPLQSTCRFTLLCTRPYFSCSPQLYVDTERPHSLAQSAEAVLELRHSRPHELPAGVPTLAARYELRHSGEATDGTTEAPCKLRFELRRSCELWVEPVRSAGPPPCPHHTLSLSHPLSPPGRVCIAAPARSRPSAAPGCRCRVSCRRRQSRSSSRWRPACWRRTGRSRRRTRLATHSSPPCTLCVTGAHSPQRARTWPTLPRPVNTTYCCR